MTTLNWILLFVVAQRAVELLISRRNTIKLLADGGIEHGVEHYPVIVCLHATWIGCLFLADPIDPTGNLTLIAVFLALQIGRMWVIFSLGHRWTTRVITVPGLPLVRHGPYRWIKHPNYMIVMLEILILLLAFGAWELAIIFSLLNAGILYHRIRIENPALSNLK